MSDFVEWWLIYGWLTLFAGGIGICDCLLKEGG